MLLVVGSVATIAAIIVRGSTVWAQAPQVRITELQCSRDPEVVAVTNQDINAQNLAGWSLKSDPIASETFDLTSVGTLAPGVTVFVQSGPGANGTFIWSHDFVFRDGDPTDFARIVDANGTVVDEVTCQRESTSPSAAPTAAPTSAPTPAPTTVPSSARVDVVPLGGGPPGSASDPFAALMLAAAVLGIGLGAVGLFVLSRPSSGVIVANRSNQLAVPSMGGTGARWVYLLILAALMAHAARILMSSGKKGGRGP
jgi:hypothetical protein